MVFHHATGTLLDVDSVSQIYRTTLLGDIVLQSGGTDGDHQGTKLHLIQRLIKHTHLEYHLGMEPPGAGQGDLIPHGKQS